MGDRVRLLRLVGLFGIAVGGVFVGHEVGYRLALPDPAHRHVVLEHTGHGYLPVAALVAGIVAVAAALAVVGLGYLRGRGRAVELPDVGSLAVRLVPGQVGVFVLLEAFERLVVGEPVGGVLGPLLWFGVLAQIVTALAGALLFVLLARGGEGLGRDAGPSPIEVCIRARPSTEADPQAVGAGPNAPRAPPLLRVAR